MRYWKTKGVKVQTCITSPPYFGLRDYGIEGQLGLEETPEDFVKNLVEVFRCLWDILKADGTLWLVLGDSYNGSGGNHKSHHKNDKGFQGKVGPQYGGKGNKVSNLKPKDLIGIPWRVAFALQADGWYLRNDIIWSKSSCMPESATDRCTKSHEYIFLLTKNRNYYFDHEAIQELANYDGRKDTLMKRSPKYLKKIMPGAREQTLASRGHERWQIDSEGNKVRNKRTVWTVPPLPYRGAHYATFPPDLILPCVLAGSKIKDIVCDPFMGSGTTAMVAKENGRCYLGCELNKENEKLQNKRIASVHYQMKLFS